MNNNETIEEIYDLFGEILDKINIYNINLILTKFWPSINGYKFFRIILFSKFKYSKRFKSEEKDVIRFILFHEIGHIVKGRSALGFFAIILILISIIASIGNPIGNYLLFIGIPLLLVSIIFFFLLLFIPFIIAYLIYFKQFREEEFEMDFYAVDNLIKYFKTEHPEFIAERALNVATNNSKFPKIIPDYHPSIEERINSIRLRIKDIYPEKN